MKNNAQNYRIRPCVACDYKFSDEHHIHVEFLGRKYSPTIILCPNHHRFAHILQNMLIKGDSDEKLNDFALKNFDSEFNQIVAPVLIDIYETLKHWEFLLNSDISSLTFNEIDKNGILRNAISEKQLTQKIDNPQEIARQVVDYEYSYIQNYIGILANQLRTEYEIAQTSLF